MRKRQITTAIAVLALLSGCVSQATENAKLAAEQNYANTLAACQTGDAIACHNVQLAQAQAQVADKQAHDEAMNNGGGALVGLAALALIAATVAGVAVAAGHPHGPGPAPHGPPPPHP